MNINILVAEKGGAQAPWAPLLDPPLTRNSQNTWNSEVWAANTTCAYEWAWPMHDQKVLRKLAGLAIYPARKKLLDLSCVSCKTWAITKYY